MLIKASASSPNFSKEHPLMATQIRRVSVIGTGVIGASWTALRS